MLPQALNNLIEEFARLPSIGQKSAERLVFYLVRQPDFVLERFAKNVAELKPALHYCPQCFSFITSTQERCQICTDEERNIKQVCVVGDIITANVIEKSGVFKGQYHILHGLISPIKSIGADDIRLNELLQRVKNDGIGELILALDQNLEGDATTLLIHKRLMDSGVKITRLGIGIPTGASVQWADERTLQSSFEARIKI